MLDVLLMPTRGRLRLKPGKPSKPQSGHRSRLSHFRNEDTLAVTPDACENLTECPHRGRRAPTAFRLSFDSSRLSAVEDAGLGNHLLDLRRFHGKDLGQDLVAVRGHQDHVLEDQAEVVEVG